MTTYTLEPLSTLAIYRIAEHTLKHQYRYPKAILTVHDYVGLHPAEAACAARKGATDWTQTELTYEVHQALHTPYFWQSQGMVCSKTGYTAKQMLAAMLNDVLAGEIDQEYMRRMDAIADAAYEVLERNWEYQNELYAQHQSRRFMV